MSVISNKVTINAPGEDIVFDGLDFTGNGFVTILAANSVTLKNCRVYGLANTGVSGQAFIDSKNCPEVKVIIENCFMGDNANVYNHINLDAFLKDGSSFSENYFTLDSCTHNHMSFYNVAEKALIKICENVIENRDGGVRLGQRGNVECTFNISKNEIIGEPVEPWVGFVCVQPSNMLTESFAKCTINMNGNKYGADRMIYGYSGSKDTMLDETNAPTVFIDGVETVLEIMH